MEPLCSCGTPIAKPRLPRSPITRPHLCTPAVSSTPLDTSLTSTTPVRYLASKKQPNIAKGTQLPSWHLDQKEPILGSAAVEVTGSGLPWMRKSDLYKEAIIPAYSKPLSVEARCLACQMRQVGIAGGKYYFLLLPVPCHGDRCHKGLTSDGSDIWACNLVGK